MPTESNEPQLVAGSMLGFRTWTFDLISEWDKRYSLSQHKPMQFSFPARRPFLASPTYGFLWKSKKVQAVCGGVSRNVHLAPHPSCSCGIYAMKTPLLIPTNYLSGSQVIGLIKATGKIVDGEKGFRAEKVEIVALAPIQDTTTGHGNLHWIEQISSELDVPLCSSIHELLLEHCPKPIIDEILHPNPEIVYCNFLAMHRAASLLKIEIAGITDYNADVYHTQALSAYRYFYKQHISGRKFGKTDLARYLISGSGA